ncbi:MAG: hypothetical protein SPI23_09040 [Desulfovibrio sp.]|uniref:hypothetical protein n=1 Tax=Desulfovibrio TaxID=872 RepID=UPI00242ADB26|nr:MULTISPECIES: hypothetical protein [Desulfovibrio]MCI7507318.1 hypothetical protein [Desulfovibrio piger]MDY6234807.1 hypothetical protein [Desulfovibrio sp.]
MMDLLFFLPDKGSGCIPVHIMPLSLRKKRLENQNRGSVKMEKTPNTLQDKAIGVRDFFAGGKWELPEDKCPFLTYEFMENS